MYLVFYVSTCTENYFPYEIYMYAITRNDCRVVPIGLYVFV